MDETREFVRYDSLNLVSYVLYGEEDFIVSQGIGRTLNLSQGGILLEIEGMLDDDIKSVSMAIAFDDSILNIDGRIAFTILTSEGHTEYGIQFKETDSNDIEIIEGYIDSVSVKSKRKPSLLREKDSRIDSLGLTLNKEHDIIFDYIESYKKLVENANDDLFIKNIDKFLTFLKKDLSDHFYFEESAVFKAAMYGYNLDLSIDDMINRLKNEHSILMNKLDEIISVTKTIKNEDEDEKDTLIRKIFVFLGHTKKHCREEIERLVSVIDLDWEKMRYLNSLLLCDID